MPPWLWLWLIGDLAVLIPAEVSNERHQIALYTGHGEIAPQVTAGTGRDLLAGTRQFLLSNVCCCCSRSCPG